MPKTLGYMLSWTTYGSWLQGDERGYVVNGQVIGKDEGLWNANINVMRQKPVELTDQQQGIVWRAIKDEASRMGQKVHALTVCRDHVHLVVGYFAKPVSEAVSRYKNAGRMGLKKHGFVGKVWTRGYDKRFCFDEELLRARIDYVKRHD